MIVLSQVEKTVSGWRCQVKPIASPDRKSVLLNMTVEHFAKDEGNAVERTTKATKTFNIPDGRTLVWDLGASVENQQLFVLATPRIVVREEVEPITLEVPPAIPAR